MEEELKQELAAMRVSADKLFAELEEPTVSVRKFMLQLITDNLRLRDELTKLDHSRFDDELQYKRQLKALCQAMEWMVKVGNLPNDGNLDKVNRMITSLKEMEND